ncbi:UNVERIFIED_CONTAM: hypothetical protein Cloal_0489 [Acetivibrio alkalicellulosi]
MDNSRNEYNDKEFKFKESANHVNELKMPLWYLKSRHGIYYTLGVIEVLLAFRFMFKLLGANTLSGFVVFLYAITNIVIAPFSGIFDSFVTNGLAAQSVFEPATLIAMMIYAIAAWGLVRLIRINLLKNDYVQ